jgi:ribosome-associated protein
VARQILTTSLEQARRAVDVASDNQASDIVLLDIGEASSFADYFVILSADSTRQIDALSEDLVDSLERSGARLHHREGTPDTGWVLLDFGDVIVHLFGRQERDFYSLENVWGRAAELVRIQ